ncbi:metal ABC transporter permease [Paenibacillus protaetiae]|uniref:Metal ABC transporter permease n=1 Tax=Paenibacillus protaetiae TaxID=2509456 RepID=A0A4P6EUJ1_9BACL|nr:metal ABC transporter permease [Paenibacillus protaetiae]QAY65783.1 metal ABC transporter permease [Paenibacillus protaetiae]
MEMLQYDFMRRAMLAGSMIALIASVLGVYLLLRRQAMVADMLSHVSLAGVALGAYLQLNPSITGFAVAIIGAAAVEYVRRVYKSFSELSVAIIMVGGLSLAMIMIAMNKSVNMNLSSYLFGSVVAVGRTDLLELFISAMIGAIFCLVFRRSLYLIAFDEDIAKASGVQVARVSLGFSVVTGMIVASAMPIVGVLLLSSLLILPAALAIRVASGFAAAILLSMITGLTGTLAGITASYAFDFPPGATIAFVLLLLLVAGLGIKRLQVIVKSYKWRIS